MFPKETRILLVDDSLTTRDLLRKILTGLGYKNFLSANDGQAATEVIMSSDAESDPIGLIISDWKMPRMDGLQLLNFVRKSSPIPTVPFLMVTAEGENATVIHAIQAGVNGYLLKPLSAQLVEERLKKIWNTKK